MRKLLFYTSFLMIFSVSAFAQIEEEETETLSRPASGQPLPKNKSENNNKPTTQNSGPVPWTDNLRFGGNFALTFGSVTYIQVSPKVGYLLTPRLLGGIGIDYIYYGVSKGYYYQNSPGYNHNIYGGSIFSTWEPFDVNTIPVALQMEFEMLNTPIYNYNTYEYDRNEWVPGLYLGGGLSQPAGAGRVYFMFLYNVLYDQNRSFNAPYVFRAGFLF